MSEKARNLEAIIDEAERIVQVWTENPSFAVGDLKLDDLKHDIEKLRSLKHSRDEMRVRLSKLVDDTKDQRKAVEAFSSRVRTGMKAVFGPDSAQYAQVGGTRASERKPGTVRKNSKAQQA